MPAQLIENLDLVFNLRQIQKKKNQKDAEQLLWPLSKVALYDLVKKVMRNADVKGAMATGKGLRHGFGVAMMTAKKPLPLHVLAS